MENRFIYFDGPPKGVSSKMPENREKPDSKEIYKEELFSLEQGLKNEEKFTKEVLSALRKTFVDKKENFLNELFKQWEKDIESINGKKKKLMLDLSAKITLLLLEELALQEGAVMTKLREDIKRTKTASENLVKAVNKRLKAPISGKERNEILGKVRKTQAKLKNLENQLQKLLEGVSEEIKLREKRKIESFQIIKNKFGEKIEKSSEGYALYTLETGEKVEMTAMGPLLLISKVGDEEERTFALEIVTLKQIEEAYKDKNEK